MDLKIKDKVMLVTGGCSGIGEGISRRIAEEGAIPVIVDRNQDLAEQLVMELKQLGCEADYMHTELQSPEACQQAVAGTADKYGRIDALFNNAGINDRIGLEHGSPQQFLESIDRSLYHYYYMAHYCLPWLKESQGSIVNISSKTALTGQGNTSGYTAAKGAQLALTREWAVELLPYNIRVNAIIPAEVKTPLYDSWLQTFKDPQQKLEDIVKNIPLGKRRTKPQEIASMAVFLASELAGHTTGQFLFVDGGYVHLDRALAGNE